MRINFNLWHKLYYLWISGEIAFFQRTQTTRVAFRLFAEAGSLQPSLQRFSAYTMYQTHWSTCLTTLCSRPNMRPMPNHSLVHSVFFTPHPHTLLQLSLFKCLKMPIANVIPAMSPSSIHSCEINGRRCSRSDFCSLCSTTLLLPSATSWQRGSVVRTFGRRTFPYICLIYGWHVTNLAFHPSGVGKWVVIHGLQGWRPLNGRPGLRKTV